jgi:ribonucleotide reductase beta subunit family protein with ferritin-like domain
MDKYAHLLINTINDDNIVNDDHTFDKGNNDDNNDNNIINITNTNNKLNFTDLPLKIEHPPSDNKDEYLMFYHKYSDDFTADIVSEPILMDEENRFTVFPIKYHLLWNIYKKHQATNWVAEEVDMSKDKYDWDLHLNENEKYFLKHIIAFFAGSDKIVNMNLMSRFKKDVKIMEATSFYDFQAYIENVHAEMYGILVETFITDIHEKEKIINGINTIPCIKLKTEWALNWIDSDKTFAHRLIAFAVVEGVFFSGSFASIFWLMQRSGILGGLIASNQFIRRDEGLHCFFACMLYRMLKNKLKQEVVYKIISEAVEIEKNFFTNALPVSLLGMNAKSMSEYIEYTADYLLAELGYEKLYKTKNPFEFMELIDMENKRNFFELKENNYQNAKIHNSDGADKYQFKLLKKY